MCILIAKPQGAPLPDEQILRQCFENNPHGCGYALPGQAPKKFMAFKKFMAAIAQEDPAQAMIIHFRLATHGEICPMNCHPFYDKRSKIAFAHNGVMDVPMIEGRTDSESAFRLLYMPAIEEGGLWGEELAEAAGATRGCGKLAFMDREGNLKMFGHFIEDGGVFYSNAGYLPWGRKRYPKRQQEQPLRHPFYWAM